MIFVPRMQSFDFDRSSPCMATVISYTCNPEISDVMSVTNSCAALQKTR